MKKGISIQSSPRGHNVVAKGNKVVVDGEEYDMPGNKNSCCLVQTNGKLCVNGYLFKNGKFKRTLGSILSQWF